MGERGVLNLGKIIQKSLFVGSVGNFLQYSAE